MLICPKCGNGQMRWRHGLVSYERCDSPGCGFTIRRCDNQQHVLDVLFSLREQLQKAEAAAGFCEAHKPDGGCRNCLVCGSIKLTRALDAICQAIEKTKVSSYSVLCDEQAVVKQVQELMQRTEKAEAARVIWEKFVYRYRSAESCDDFPAIDRDVDAAKEKP